MRRHGATARRREEVGVTGQSTKDTSAKVEAALRRFDDANRRDPRSVEFKGGTFPREYLHAQKLHEWVLKLAPGASVALRLASRSNAICRWEIPRESYPKTTAGYHAWRKKLQKFHTERAVEILKDEDFGDDEIARVTDLILMKHFPKDLDAQILEDADCLTFLETKFHDYIPQWDESKTIRILKGTLNKMTPAAKSLASQIPLNAAARELIRKAIA